jgi:hypothetical protein
MMAASLVRRFHTKVTKVKGRVEGSIRRGRNTRPRLSSLSHRAWSVEAGLEAVLSHILDSIRFRFLF